MIGSKTSDGWTKPPSAGTPARDFGKAGARWPGWRRCSYHGGAEQRDGPGRLGAGRDHLVDLDSGEESPSCNIEDTGRASGELACGHRSQLARDTLLGQQAQQQRPTCSSKPFSNSRSASSSTSHSTLDSERLSCRCTREKGGGKGGVHVRPAKHWFVKLARGGPQMEIGASNRFRRVS